ncbi:FAD-binding domain-containing protein, partial [Lophium mytilinum]
CVFTPRNSKDVAAAIPILKQSKTQFAVRGHGHMTVKGAASINDGVLIALTKLNSLSISSDLKVASLTPGRSWLEVYNWIQPYNRVIVGGRYAPVGVSGLLLGGGISYFGGQYGWAANNVINYELVNGNGKIVNVNASSNSDLFWALKGGGSNFGIVTRFDVQTHSGGKVSAGTFEYGTSTVEDALVATESWVSPGGGIDNGKLALSPIYYVDPVSGNRTAIVLGFDAENGRSLRNFSEGAVASTVKERAFADFVAEGAASGQALNIVSNAFHCTSFKASAETVRLINTTVVPEVQKSLAKVPGAQIAFNMQPLSKGWFEAAKKAGGDAIDLDPADGSIIVLNLYTRWSKAADDDKVARWAKNVLQELQDKAKAVGLYYPFIYLNDAAAGEEPFPLYGKGKSLQKMKQIRKKYDPDGVFQDLMPGGFKLGK